MTYYNFLNATAVKGLIEEFNITKFTETQLRIFITFSNFSESADLQNRTKEILFNYFSFEIYWIRTI